ncbi:hypothetical protein LshimejAT787_0212240 [Lyophyllum shimeji]|uniref:DUF6593 domain-containing protein n=1 Tax=Lyophyllum shimeji TaxID=47721 RepID=A0A9P3PHN7_LYOSH|nr:hypothetical protein LshimejAT787_0212240 [Lyophyllum shimeji]
MHLYLSTPSPLNATFTNEDGQVMYKVDTPMAVGTRTSTISCVVPNDIPQQQSDSSAAEESMKDRFAHLAQVEHNVVGSSVLRFGGKEILTKEYFRKEGWGAYGRHRVFTASDGREYKWLLQTFTPKLIVNDESKGVVAKFHRRNLGIIGKPRPRSLEIFPAGEHMVQEILVTFVYVEKIRKDRENAAR